MTEVRWRPALLYPPNPSSMAHHLLHYHDLHQKRNKALRDSITDLEHDYYVFKEKTTNHLDQLQNLTSHTIMDQLQQLFPAVGCLEETNHELKQELRSVKEELFRRDQYSMELQQELKRTREELKKREQHGVLNGEGIYPRLLAESSTIPNLRRRRTVMAAPIITNSTPSSSRRCDGHVSALVNPS
ncbi:hypothetical protein KOW79_002988 [Hemibagrus wyckioides]|uniref:Uncharacterized protein n=1 Tax=Hemibagrus wyckioides TaxID=337641 RepID=A0A9D3SVK4_9TELE|nr:hypothetical protein KOW79_002988 [Hemibagrus wyckioides]